MKDIFIELIKRYEEKRKDLHIEIDPEKPLWKEIISPSKTLKAEDVLEQEIEFYRSFEQDIIAFPKLRNKTISFNDWKEIAHFLKVHNERLSSQIDNSTTVSAMFAALAMLSGILANSLGPQNWLILAIVLWAAFQTFVSRIEKRHELSRNRELLAIIENYLSKNA